MSLRSYRSIVQAGLTLFAVSACGGNAVLSSSPGAPNPALQAPAVREGYGQPADSKSILKLLTKSVVIGSTVDPTNGDKGPHSLSIVRCDCSGALTKASAMRPTVS